MLPRKSYNEEANMRNNGRQYWVSAVHMNFMMWGEYVWPKCAKCKLVFVYWAVQ